MAKNKVYAYYLEQEYKSGFCTTWDECKSIIEGKKAKYKGFSSKEEAKIWLESGAEYTKKIKHILIDGIYFDAGTGRGIGVEVRVTDKNGISLISNIVPKEKINEYGNYLTKEGSTNNFGELLGCYIALKIAIKNNIKNIFGDSKLIIDYWSLGRIKKNEIAKETVELSEKVTALRKEFEINGGTISHISGDYNPADLGFHK